MNRRLGYLLIHLLPLFVFLVYLAGAAPGPWWGDGLELTCAARTLGVPHPTGYPLYTATGFVATRLLGFVDPGRAMTLYSAALLAVAVALMLRVALDLMRRELPPLAGRAEPGCPMQDLLPAAGVALLVAFAPTLWAHATFPEVYPLTFLIGMALVWWTRAAAVRVESGAAPRPVRDSLILGAIFGLGLLNHYSILAMAPLVALAAGRRHWDEQRRRARARPAARGQAEPELTLVNPFMAMRLGMVVAVALGVAALGYGWMMLRAAMNPPLNWGDPSSLENLVWVLTGGQFRLLKVEAEAGAAALGFARWIMWWGERWLPLARPHWALSAPLGVVALGLAIHGLLKLVEVRWDWAWGLLAALAVSALFAVTYHIPDIEPYFLVGLPAAAVGWMAAAADLTRRLRVRHPEAIRGPLPRAMPAAVALLLVLGMWPHIDKSWDEASLIYGERVMEAVAPDALVVTQGDNDIYALWYQQLALDVRPDVTVYGSGFVFQHWYARYFEHEGRPRIDVGTEPSRAGFVQGKWQADAALFRLVLLPNLAAGRPVYTTFLDPPHIDVLSAYFAPEPVAALMAPEYYEMTSYPFPSALPGPLLYRLQPNPRLAAMDAAELAAELKAQYTREAQQRRVEQARRRAGQARERVEEMDTPTEE